MRFLYTFLLYIGLPWVLGRQWIRRIKHRNTLYTQNVSQRFGCFPHPVLKHSIWIHAVSVGETLAAEPLIHALIKQYPTLPIVLTSTTVTGSDLVGKRFAGKVLRSYFPYDFPFAWKKFLHRTRPTIAIIMETELWPNMIAALHEKNIPTLLANARLSERSANRYGRIAWISRPMIQAITHIAAQDKDTQEHFLTLGAKTKQCSVLGSLKSELVISNATIEQAEALRKRIGERPIWIAGSTHPGEEAYMIAAHRTVKETLPKALLILVPRHPERCPEIETLLQGFSVAKSSDLPDSLSNIDVLLVNTLGTLVMLYGVADVAVVAGSFVDIGGHNLLEPAAWKKPIITGPYLRNFVQIAKTMHQQKALLPIGNAELLAPALLAVLSDPEKAEKLGENAYAFVAQHRGALKRHTDLVAHLLENNTHA